MTHDPNLRKDLETLREEVDGLLVEYLRINQKTKEALALITARLSAIEEALKLK
jgi:hypothetical protein